jgi:hypothetical protein
MCDRVTPAPPPSIAFVLFCMRCLRGLCQALFSWCELEAQHCKSTKECSVVVAVARMVCAAGLCYHFAFRHADMAPGRMRHSSHFRQHLRAIQKRRQYFAIRDLTLASSAPTSLASSPCRLSGRSPASYNVSSVHCVAGMRRNVILPY